VQSNQHRKRNENDAIRDDTKPAANLTPLEAKLGNMTNAERRYAPPRAHLTKRGFDTELNGNWHLSQVSWPKYLPWDGILYLDDGSKHDPSNDKYAYFYDDVMGLGQKFYMIEAGWLRDVEVKQLLASVKLHTMLMPVSTRNTRITGERSR
jgi:hypothetical protein